MQSNATRDVIWPEWAPLGLIKQIGFRAIPDEISDESTLYDLTATHWLAFTATSTGWGVYKQSIISLKPHSHFRQNNYYSFQSFHSVTANIWFPHAQQVSFGLKILQLNVSCVSLKHHNVNTSKDSTYIHSTSQEFLSII